MKKVGIITVASMMSACAVAPAQVAPAVDSWVATMAKDEFTDQHICTVSIRNVGADQAEESATQRYYPYIEVVNGDQRVGVKSTAKIPRAVGDIKIRIDSNPAWDIDTSETPLGEISGSELREFEITMASLPAESLAIAKANHQKTLEAMMRAQSIYTATSGDKARAIVREMYAGETIKFRVLASSKVTTFTGEYDLGASFKVAADECGIAL